MEGKWNKKTCFRFFFEKKKTREKRKTQRERSEKIKEKHCKEKDKKTER